jgi:phenylacetic acid degradation protein paaN
MMGGMTVTTEFTDSHPLFDRHEETLRPALDTIRRRGYFSAYPESPSPRIYGETAAADGKAAFEAYLGADFPLDQPGAAVGSERSPYGVPLGIRYPHADPDVLIGNATAALPGWRDAGIAARTGACLEILATLHRHVFELANAVQFTTGQAFVMAFQAGGTNALDRGLEAVAYGYAAMTRHVAETDWEKPSKRNPLRMHKRFHVVPRGVALLVGCNTFPTWNGYPGLFASLVTGNPVIVKPHPGAVLPLAITVRYARDVLRANGFDPNLVQLAAEAPGEGMASTLAVRPEVRIVDFTGSTAYGDWLEANARQAKVYTEKAGVNTVVVDSTDDFAGMCANLAFSLSLYSGQMCTTPQNILVPEAGIDTDAGHKTAAEVGAGIAAAVHALTDDDARGVELTGAIVNDGVLERLAAASTLGEPVLDSRTVRHPGLPDAVVRTPLIRALSAADTDTYGREWFGPIAFLVRTGSTADSLAIFERTVTDRGALTASVYSTDPAVLAAAERAALNAGVHLSANLTGGVYVNQSAAFSDFHGTGANPAANACLTDDAYVSARFAIVQYRTHA